VTAIVQSSVVQTKTMAKRPKRLPPKYQVWVDAMRKFRLSNAHIQMARELGLNPKKMGGLANHRQEPWKVPLPQFIENLYHERFGRDMPDEVLTMEEVWKRKQQKSVERREGKKQVTEEEAGEFPF